MQTTEKAHQNDVVFKCGRKAINKYSKEMEKLSPYWKESSAFIKKSAKRCVIVCLVVFVISLLISIGSPWKDRLICVSLITGLFIYGCLAAMLIICKNEHNGLRGMTHRWGSFKVTFTSDRMSCSYIRWDDVIGRYGTGGRKMDIVMRGYTPVYVSTVMLEGVKAIYFCKPRKIIVINAEGADKIMTQQGKLVESTPFSKVSRKKSRLVYIPLMFKNNEEFLSYLKSRINMPFIEVNTLLEIDDPNRIRPDPNDTRPRWDTIR